MKKLLGIIVISLLWFSNSYANCVNEGLDWGWYYNGDKTAAHFEFSNTSNKHFFISKLVLYSAANDIVASRGTRIHIKPFGKYNTEGKYSIGLRDINVQYIATGNVYCELTTAEKAKSQTSLDFSKFNKKKKSGFKWWYLLFIPVGLVIIGAIFGEDKQGSKSKIASGENFIVDVWEGKKPLGESFWLYFIVINGVISFGSGYFAEINDNNIFLVAALASNIWAGVGTWNSSTNYQLTKIKKRKPHGWAYAAKAVVFLNFLSLAGQLILLFNT